METTKSIVEVNKEISNELKDPNVARALLKTTFKGLEEPSMKQAIFEGMVRGFTFKDFLEKNVYAIPFKDGYSLVTSIDYARKIGMRSNVVGKSAPVYETNKGDIESCTITIKRRVGQDIGEYTATVYMNEYYKAGKNGYPSLWDSKPRTMLAKVAEMHALRMACPETISQLYTEEELDSEKGTNGKESWKVEQLQREGYDTSDIADDVKVESTGDDHSVNEPVIQAEPEMPEDEAVQLNLIKGLVAKKWPDTNLKSPKDIKTKIEDETQLAFTPTNYKEIIRILR